jgi:hypothetical protein
MTQGEHRTILALRQPRFPHGGKFMRKLLALALLALALAGGVAVVSVERPTPAHADCGGGCG